MNEPRQRQSKKKGYWICCWSSLVKHFHPPPPEILVMAELQKSKTIHSTRKSTDLERLHKILNWWKCARVKNVFVCVQVSKQSSKSSQVSISMWLWKNRENALTLFGALHSISISFFYAAFLSFVLCCWVCIEHYFLGS